MFKNLRWRLTILFMLLSTVVYVTLTALGVFLFHVGLTNALDNEFGDLEAEILPTLEYDGYHLQLRSWTRKLQTQPFKLLATIQLYDLNAQLVQEYGHPGIPELFRNTKEANTAHYAVRSRSTPVLVDGKPIGFLQIQLPTRNRDHAMRQFATTMIFLAPLLLLGLGIVGYFFAGAATRPVEMSFLILRRFLTDAGHELSTPLSIIQATTENLTRKNANNGTLKQLLNIIARSTDRMAKLVQDLMLLSNIEAQQFAHQHIMVRIDKVISLIVDEFRELSKQKNIKISCKELAAANLFGDPDALHRMISNLLDNALRYTEPKGSITVSTRLQGNNICIVVEDTGIGIPADAIPYLFDRFYRVDKSRSRSVGGSGLGLAIVKAIVESHHGYIEVSSQLAKGTRFTITLPIINKANSLAISQEALSPTT